MTRDELIDDIRSDLGEPTVKVELDPVSFDKIINKGLRWFRAKKGLITTAPITLLPGLREYDFPLSAYEIVDVYLPFRSDILDVASLDFFDIIPANSLQVSSSNYGSGGGGSFRFDSSGYMQMLQTLNQRRRIFAAEQDWYVLGNKIHVQHKNLSGTAVVFCKKDNIDVTDFRGRDEDLFYRYCLAKAKAVLGTIRSKYSTYPAAGGSITTDGEALKAESRDEMAKLDEEIADSQGNAGGIVTG